MTDPRGQFVPRSAVPHILWPAIPPAPGATMLALQFQLQQIEQSSGNAVRGMGRLTNVMGNFAQQIAGVNPVIGKTVEFESLVATFISSTGRAKLQ